MNIITRIVTTAIAVLTLAAGVTACDGLDSSGTVTNGHHKASKNDKGDKGDKAPSFTAAQDQAIQAAQSYLGLGTGFSRAGLIQQLSSKAGNGFKTADAVFAVNHLKVDYNKQAVEAAKAYLSLGTGFSRASLIEQLTSKAGNEFTRAQATYAVNHVGL